MWSSSAADRLRWTTRTSSSAALVAPSRAPPAQARTSLSCYLVGPSIPTLPLALTLTLTLGEDVSRLLPSRAATFQARKTPLDKAMLAAKARVRTLTLTLAAKARARRELTLNLTPTPTRTLTLILKGARAKGADDPRQPVGAQVDIRG